MYFYSDPVEIGGEIHFRITDYKMNRFNFVVTRTAIENTCLSRGRRRTDFNHMEAFKKVEDKIHSLATKMIEAGVRADPIFITSELLNR
ncbi:MAG TPA: hypothetical protein VFF75_08400 [Methylophilaceae bacterium]|jgi:hypothetical protein|nr:hypothetical protein [Methylophilaceae bacterium]